MDEQKLPEMELPEVPPEAPPKAPPVESPEKVLELAERLYEAATKLQRDADELMKAVRAEEPEPEPVEKMTPEESEAANQAILGL